MTESTASLKRVVRLLGVVTAIGMFIVLVMGSTVTNTGSEHGCGKSWPLCHGRLIPQFAVSTLIEWSHRAVVGVETVLILALAAGALWLYRDRLEVRILVPVMVLFLFLQAGLGAWAVMAPQLSAVLALHFGVSLIAFASVMLTAVMLYEIDGMGGFDQMRRIALPRRFVWYSWLLIGFTYIVVYSGAYVRHTNADDVCRGWPLCNGVALPAMASKASTNLGHRVLALMLTVAIVGLFMWARQFKAERRDIYLAAHAAVALVVMQAVVGAVVVWTHVDLFSALAHAATVGLLFSALSYLCVHTFPLPATQRAVVPQPSPAHVGATSAGP